MDNALARHVALATYRSKQGLDDLVELLQNHCSDSEIQNFRLALEAVGRKFELLLSLVFAGHPGLEQDIAGKKQKFGRPL